MRGPQRPLKTMAVAATPLLIDELLCDGALYVAALLIVVIVVLIVVNIVLSNVEVINVVLEDVVLDDVGRWVLVPLCVADDQAVRQLIAEVVCEVQPEASAKCSLNNLQNVVRTLCMM